ncbi:hypothetical protein EHQ35_16590 [Leptospira wolffii]|nr:hypothetical protein EHQ32_17920 [Leptospira wolffii]TGK70584.1 hypothetical protein EHQ35_16590 [Leptospira wolffii]
MQDATSPSHSLFQDWRKQSTLTKILGLFHTLKENKYPAQNSLGQRKLEGATKWMSDIYQGKEKMPKQFFDPKSGELQLPEKYYLTGNKGTPAPKTNPFLTNSSGALGH